MTTEKFSLQLEPRNVTGKAVRKLRHQGIVPVGVFGKGIEPTNAQVNEREFAKVLRSAGANSLVEIEMPGSGKQQVFIQEVQRHPVTRRILHIDLHVVDLLTEVSHSVPVHITGESSLVERGDAVLNVALHAIDVRSLPTDMPHQVDVDISGLTEIGQTIHVSDLSLGDKVQILTPGDETVVSLTAARMATEEEEAEAPEGDETQPSLIRQDRDTEEE